MRRTLKCGGHPRKKAFAGADGAIMASATLAAAGINAAATASAAKSQASAIEQSANIQAQSIKDQTSNNNALQQESLNFTRQQNMENRNQQQEIQTTLQMLAGQQNMNDRMEATKVAVKYGGRPKRNRLATMSSIGQRRIKDSVKNYNKKNYDEVDYDALIRAGLIPDDYDVNSPFNAPIKAKRGIGHSFYGGASAPFVVTDGGGAIPLQTDANGYGLYELYGNDHEHYHKTKDGKYKSGVGVRFADGSVVEGEGNQNTNKGEKLLVTPDDAMFISKHSIAGFNPSDAVDAGMPAQQAFAKQQALKFMKGINDDGSKMSKKDRAHALVGLNLLVDTNQTQFPLNGTAPVAGGVAYALNSRMLPQTTVAKCGGHRKLRHGGRVKAELGYEQYKHKNNWNQYAGATYSGIGNLLGAGINVLGNYFAGNTMANAYASAGNILADAYGQMHGISMSELNREDYAPAHAMAVVRSSNTNVNPQQERLRRNAESEARLVNRNTLSSAARQQRLAGINDRLYQRASELAASKNTADEQIRQENAARIQEASETNAKLDTQANQAYGAARLNLLQYNNNIENTKIAGRAQSLADAMTQTGMTRSNAMINSSSALGSALAATGQGFANAFTASQKSKQDLRNALLGADTSATVNYLTSLDPKNIDEELRNIAKSIYDNVSGLTDERSKQIASALARKFGFK